MYIYDHYILIVNIMTTCVHIAVHGGRSVEVCIYKSVLLHHNAKYLLLKVLPVLVCMEITAQGGTL